MKYSLSPREMQRAIRRDLPRTQAIFHRKFRLEYHYIHSQL